MDTGGARPWNDREVTQLMLTPVEDGGQFVFCCNLVKKWGAIPKALMPDTACNKDTAQMNALLTTLLRKDATILRKMAANGATLEELRAKKQEMLPEFHQILCCCLGEPPVTSTSRLRWARVPTSTPQRSRRSSPPTVASRDASCATRASRPAVRRALREA